MRFAIYGDWTFGVKLKKFLRETDIEITHFIAPVSNALDSTSDVRAGIETVSFFECKHLIKTGQLDGIIISDTVLAPFTKKAVKYLKLNGISKVGVIVNGSIVAGTTVNNLTGVSLKTPKDIVYWLDMSKGYMPHLEVHVADSCNLNCKGCAHFSSLFKSNEHYDVTSFERDIRRVSETMDLIRLILLGGEPLMQGNIDVYSDIARKYLPKTHIKILTNGLLIPGMSETFFDSVKRNRILISIDPYPPVVKMLDKIRSALDRHEVDYIIGDKPIEEFCLFLTLDGKHNGDVSRSNCLCDTGRAMRDGKIYKCNTDAYSYRYKEHFDIKNFPDGTAVDIYAPNFVSMVDELDGAVELCNWCNETMRPIPWQISDRHHTKDEWLY